MLCEFQVYSQVIQLYMHKELEKEEIWFLCPNFTII